MRSLREDWQMAQEWQMAETARSIEVMHILQQMHDAELGEIEDKYLRYLQAQHQYLQCIPFTINPNYLYANDQDQR